MDRPSTTVEITNRQERKALFPPLLFDAMSFAEILLVLFTGFYREWCVFFDSSSISITLLIVSGVITFFLGIAIIQVATSCFAIRPSLFLTVLFGVLALGAVIATQVTSSVSITFGDFRTYSFGFTERVEGSIEALSAFFGLYVLYAFVAKCAHTRPFIWFCLEAMIGIAIASAIYSFATEGAIYRRIFTLHDMLEWLSPTSWTSHKNTYGRYLMIGILAELCLLRRDRFWWRFITIGFLAFSLSLTMAKLPIIIAAISLFLFMVLEGVSALKRLRKTAISLLTVSGLILLTGITLFSVPSTYLGGLGKLIDAIKYNGSIGGGGTIDSRILIWSRFASLFGSIDPFKQIFGLGDLAFPQVFYQALDLPGDTPLGSAHNAVLESLGRGGFVRVLCFFGLLCFLIVQLVRLYRRDLHAGVFYTLILMGYVGHGVLESTNFFAWTYENMAWLIMFVPGILSLGANENKPCRAKAKRQAPLPFYDIAISLAGPCFGLCMSFDQNWLRFALFSLGTVLLIATIKAQKPASLIGWCQVLLPGLVGLLVSYGMAGEHYVSRVGAGVIPVFILLILVSYDKLRGAKKQNSDSVVSA